MAPGLGDAQAGDDLVGAAGGDAPEVEAVAAVPAATLAEVEGTEAAARRSCWARDASRSATAARGSRRLRIMSSETSKASKGMVTTPCGWVSPSSAQVP
jgi:hypothetical protein